MESNIIFFTLFFVFYLQNIYQLIELILMLIISVIDDLQFLLRLKDMGNCQRELIRFQMEPNLLILHCFSNSVSNDICSTDNSYYLARFFYR
jgi:hypothetical protein